MMKKIILILLFVSLGLAALVLSRKTDPLEEQCPFCSEQILERQTVYEQESILVLYPHKPGIPGHVLIVPKRHVERFEELENEELIAIKEVVEKIHGAEQELFGCDDYILLQKNGPTAGLSVPHLHFNYYPTKSEQGMGILYCARLFLMSRLPPMSEQAMIEAVGNLKEVLNPSADLAYEHAPLQDDDSVDHTF